MGRAKPLILDTISFNSRDEATQFFKKMLYSYGIGEKISDQDAPHLRALLENHPELEEKLGDGYSHFTIMAAEFNTRCFCIVRKDGTSIDFSYPYCIKNSPANK